MSNGYRTVSRGTLREHDWALVLAGGEGKRLQQLTRTHSGAVPKQFCSLAGGQTLLQDAMQRARSVVAANQTCAVVTARHREWWEPQLSGLPRENIIVQTHALGTAIGILLPLLNILRRDPDAHLLVLPSDHFVRDESLLASAMSRALNLSREHAGSLILLGIEPEEADSEFGYILPTPIQDDGLQRVSQFIEKPDGVTAREAIARGALWNSFIFAVRGSTLLEMFRRIAPRLVSELASGSSSAADLGAKLVNASAMDFSSDVLQQCPDILRVLTVPACGWSDLGTPRRLAGVLSTEEFQSPSCRVSATPFMNLAHQLALHHGM